MPNVDHQRQSSTMTQNPYQSPAAPSQHETLHSDSPRVARYRRWVVFCMVGQAIYYLLYALQLAPNILELRLSMQITLYAVGVVFLVLGTIATGLLASTVHHPAIAVFLGVASFYPVLGFLPMAWVFFRSRRHATGGIDKS